MTGVWSQAAISFSQRGRIGDVRRDDVAGRLEVAVGVAGVGDLPEAVADELPPLLVGALLPGRPENLHVVVVHRQQAREAGKQQALRQVSAGAEDQDAHALGHSTSVGSLPSGLRPLARGAARC